MKYQIGQHIIQNVEKKIYIFGVTLLDYTFHTIIISRMS